MKLNKEFKNIGFILDKSQFDGYQKICQRLFFEENILEYGLHGFEQIDFSKKDYLSSDLYKLGNILLIPYHINDFSWYLSPWQILNTDNGTTLHCKHVLFNAKFNECIRLSKGWKNSSLRKYLNSDEFFNRFPKSIQKNISFHDIWTNREKTSDRFWLLSWQELGKVIKDDKIIPGATNEFFKQDYPSEKERYNSDIFKTKEDLIKYQILPIDNLHHPEWWLRSTPVKYYRECSIILEKGDITSVYNDYDGNCSPVFILD